MSEDSKKLMDKSEKKALNLFVSILCIIVLLSFGAVIYKDFNKSKLSKYLDTIERLSQGENPQKYKLYLVESLNKIKNERLRAIIYSKLGYVNLSLKNYPGAVDAYRNSYNLYSDDAELCTNLGLALGETGKPEEAIKYLNIAKELNPKIPQIYNNLGLQFANQEKKSEAIASFKKAIEIDPKFYRAYANLSAVYFILKDYKNTKKYINLAIKNGANADPVFKELLQQQSTELSRLENTTTELP